MLSNEWNNMKHAKEKEKKKVLKQLIIRNSYTARCFKALLLSGISFFHLRVHRHHLSCVSHNSLIKFFVDNHQSINQP